MWLVRAVRSRRGRPVRTSERLRSPAPQAGGRPRRGTEGPGPREVLEHVKPVTLRLEQVAVWARPWVRLSAKAPGDVHDVAQQAVINGTTGLLHGARIPVVEVDREEELPLLRLGDQLLGLVE